MSEEPERKHPQVRIHIDQKLYHSPNPTNGATLYILGHLAAGLELYREVTGDKEDKPIENGPETIHLKEDEHFHSGAAQQKQFDIFVNGRKKIVTAREFSFDRVVALAFNPIPTGPNVMFTITYRHGPHENPKGDFLPGGILKIKGGMIFNVTQTDKS